MRNIPGLLAQPDIESGSTFVPGPGFARLDLKFDLGQLRLATDAVLSQFSDIGDGFSNLIMTRQPGQTVFGQADLSGLFHTRPDDSYVEVPREVEVDEAAYSEVRPEFVDTYFAQVHSELSNHFTLGRMRLLAKDPLNCNSWHRDPEPRLHIPIYTNGGAIMMINQHCTHLPADGSVYFTDTRGYHSAINGGEHRRVHLVAAVVLDQ